MKIIEMKNVATRVVSRAGLKLSKHSPEILMAAGTIAVIGGVVLACKATLHAEEVLDKHKDEMETINNAVELDEDYAANGMQCDKVLAYAHTVGGFIKLYAPAVGATALGIGCFLGAYGIVQKRYLAVVAAYDGLQKTFLEYRERVREKLGEDEEKKLYYGAEKIEINEEEKKLVLPNGYTPSVYSRFFDETSTQWTRNATLNKMNLINWQNWANDLLNAHGHVFLNEVYDMLGIPRSREGAVVGWVKHGDGDGYIDFGMFNVQREKTRDFVNGLEYSILLDFNVDGVIYDKI